jgi:hypothetical protein
MAGLAILEYVSSKIQASNFKFADLGAKKQQ